MTCPITRRARFSSLASDPHLVARASPCQSRVASPAPFASLASCATMGQAGVENVRRKKGDRTKKDSGSQSQHFQCQHMHREACSPLQSQQNRLVESSHAFSLSLTIASIAVLRMQSRSREQQTSTTKHRSFARCLENPDIGSSRKLKNSPALRVGQHSRCTGRRPRHRTCLVDPECVSERVYPFFCFVAPRRRAHSLNPTCEPCRVDTGRLLS